MRKKVFSLLIALTMIIGSTSVFPSMQASAAPSNLTRAAVYTLDEGNIARHADVVQTVNSSTTAANTNRTYNANGTTVGITASYVASGNGSNNVFAFMNNGVLATTSGASDLNQRNWNSYGANAGPQYVVLRWNAPYIIDSSRVMWWYDGSGVTLPIEGSGTITTTSTNRTSIQYWNMTNARWENVSNIQDASGTSVTSIGVAGSGNAQANRTWNGITFTPVTTDRVRLVIQKGSGNGVGVGEWEVFGVSNPALADLAAIPDIFLIGLKSDVTLPSTGASGSTITWSNSTNTAFSNSGTVIRPAEGQPNATGTIIATAQKDSYIETKTFNFSVLSMRANAEVPNITVQPQESSTINAANPSLTLSVTANVTDGGTLSYQWFKNTNASNAGGTAIVGETARTFKVPDEEAGTFYYYVVVTNTNDAADNPSATAISTASTVVITSFVKSIEINPVNNLNPIRYTVNGGPGNAKFRDFFRADTANTFIRPGESVTYVSIVDGVGIDKNPTWSISGGIGSTAISSGGKLFVDPEQPVGEIIVKATVAGEFVTARVNVRKVSDAAGYDQRAKWTVEPFNLSEVSLTEGNLWSKNMDITLRYLMQGNREEMELKQFYMTAGITTLPVAINGKAAGSAVSALADAPGWDGLGYATNRLVHRALSGHAAGHYMSALSNAYQVTHNETQKSTFLSKMKLMVQELGRVQDTNIEKGSYMYGFLSAYSEHQFDVIEEDKNNVQVNTGTSTRSAWAVYYTQHKIIQGLLDIYTLLKGTEDEATAQRALEIASKMGDWTYLRLSRWTQADRELMWNVYSDGEIGGIAQPIEQLYFITGDPLYRETATFFEHNNNWNSTGSRGVTNTDGYEVTPGTTKATTRSADAFYAHFAKGQDGNWLNGKHANTIIPMVISSLREYEADTPLDNTRINPVGYTPAPTHYYDIAKNFFNSVYTTRLSPNGGTGYGEYFQSFSNPVTPSWSSGLGTGNGNCNESCTTINMMLLASSLFRHEQRAEYMDYYERALLNHELAVLAQNSSATQNRIDYLFYMGTNATRAHDRYGDGACCNGSGYEMHTEYQEHVYYKTKDGKGLFVNLYMPTTLNWAEKGFEIIQDTDYLNEGSSTITVNGNGPLDFYLRVPSWIEKGYQVKVNGDLVIEDAPRSSYVKISRTWSTGDKIEISMPFSVRLERSPENTTNTTVIMFYGPILMVQRPGVASRPTITGLDFSDLDSSFDKTIGPSNTHSFGNYTAFRLTRNGQNYDPMYTATTNNTTYCMNFTVARSGDNITANRGVTAGSGTISSISNNRTLTNGQSINRGSIITYKATPDDGNKIYQWKYNGLVVGGNTSDAYTLMGSNSDMNASVVFVPEEGTGFTASALEPGKTLEAVTSFKTPATGKIYLAMYDTNNRLLSLKVSDEFEVNPAAGEDEMIVTSLQLPENVTGTTVKAFVWDDNYVPIFPDAKIN